MSLHRNSEQHIPVLLNEVLEALLTNSAGIYIDGTFGRGGHSRAILKNLSATGMLLGIDKDPQAIISAEKLAAQDSRFNFYHGSFIALNKTLNSQQVDGILLDLGVSSPQLDNPERGFSFMHDGPLDMRMNTTCGASAADWINHAKEKEISRVIWEYGEDRFSHRIARTIIRVRAKVPITTTKQLAKIIASASPLRKKGKHPATRTFQAIRIYINRELNDLMDCLDKCLQVLKPRGRLVIISFHSLEDRIVKKFIRTQVTGDTFPRWIPITEDQLNKNMQVISKAIKPSDQEVQTNPRARSAIMRIAEKLTRTR